MKTNLKENIFIEGFEDKDLYYLSLIEIEDTEECQIIYYGLTSEIPENIAEEIVKYNSIASMYLLYDSPSEDGTLADYRAITAKKSLMSSCNRKYCIIYKGL